MPEKARDKPLHKLLEQRLGEVVAHFTVTRIPKGGVDPEIKAQWLGVPLPVREKPLAMANDRPVYFDRINLRMTESVDPIPVQVFDAVAALKSAGREEAAEFWLDRVRIFSELVFERSEGQLVALELCQEA